MPATRSFKILRGSTSNPIDLSPASDKIIVISSDDETYSPAVTLRKERMEIRGLKKKLEAKEPLNSPKTRSTSQAQVLSEQGNKVIPFAATLARAKTMENKVSHLEDELSRALADATKYRIALEHEKEVRARDSLNLGDARKRLRVCERENKDLVTENKRLLKYAEGNSNKVLESLEEYIVCDICQETLWQPYTLVECGHTSCKNCLLNWFNATVTRTPAQNALDIEYACPKCRTMVHQKPIEDFALKSVVQAIAIAIDSKNIAPCQKTRPEVWGKFFLA